jgi:hypothetical protein
MYKYWEAPELIERLKETTAHLELAKNQLTVMCTNDSCLDLRIRNMTRAIVQMELPERDYRGRLVGVELKDIQDNV